MLAFIIFMALTRAASSCEGSKQCSDPNASPQDCPRYCQPTCAQPNTTDLLCTQQCLPSGCVCNKGYILDAPGGKCIKESECRFSNACSDPNASPQDCPRFCQPTCAQPNTTYLLCTTQCLPSGCVCNTGYILNETGGICILEEDCPTVSCNGDPNAIPVNLPTSCQPTCNQLNINGLVCDVTLANKGCRCKAGFVLEKSTGLCIDPQQCTDYPHVCPSDNNALLVRNPSPCPPTCASPNRRTEPCSEECLQEGCECSLGYILSDIGGTCIDPNECPGGSPACGENKTFVDCFVDCVSKYCPVNDNCVSDVCKVTYPCASPGCACAEGFLMYSTEDPRCVSPSDCPPMRCTGPNEKWESYTACVESCREGDSECIGKCPAYGRCSCKSGFLRDISGNCVSVIIIL